MNSNLILLLILLLSYTKIDGEKINDIWEFKYNDKILLCCTLPESPIEFEISSKQIKTIDSFSFNYEPCAMWFQKHTTQIFLSTSKHRVIVSSEANDAYPLGTGKFAATRFKEISDSLKQKVFEVHVFLDTPHEKPFIIARLRLVK